MLRHLIAANRFKITVITRSESSSTFPEAPSVTVKKGSYNDPAFLESAFKGNDAAFLSFSFTGTPEQPKLIDAAAKAGVKWILPNEFASDGKVEKMVDDCPVLQPKREARKQIEKLGQTYPGLSYIAVATNPWINHAIHLGLLHNVSERKAKISEDGGRFNLTSLDRAGEGVTKLLTLPIENKENPRTSLQHYANNYAYLSSLSTTQRGALDAMQRITGTTDNDWTIETDNIAERIKKDKEAMAGGGDAAFGAMMDILVAYYTGDGLGGDYQSKALEDLKVLGLKEEDIDAAFSRELEIGPPKVHVQ